MDSADNRDQDDLDARLLGLREGREVSDDQAFGGEEVPTKPETPSSKPPKGGKQMCRHGLAAEVCEECRLLLEHGGRYAIFHQEDGGPPKED